MSYAQNWAGLSASRKAGIGFVFLWFFFGSQIHFFKTSFDLSIMPPYIPHPLAAVYLSGVLEMIGALGLLFLRTRQLAGTMLFLLTIAVTPVHIYMLQYPERFPQVPLWALWLRLVVQALFLACIWWSTQPKVLKPGNNHGS